MKEIKIKGIKKAVGVWNITSRIAARVYLNKKTGEVWTIEFASLSSWMNYDDPDIVEIAKHGNLDFYPMTMKRMKEIIALEAEEVEAD